MKCKYKFSVVSTVCLEGDVRFESGGRLYELSNDNGRFGTLSVTVDNFPLDSLPTVEMLDPESSGGVSASVVFPRDPGWTDLSAHLRTVEGLLSIWGIEEIDLNSFHQQWIAESPEEQAAIQIPEFTSLLEEPEVKTAQMDMLIRSIFAADTLDQFEIPLNFFRQGKLDLKYKRFVIAVYNFFFCLETQFGDGHFRTRDLVRAFRSAPQLMAAIDAAKDFPGASLGEGTTFAEELRDRYLNRTADEIAQTIVDLRGELHHHTLKKKGHWNPGVQREYEADALVLQWICHHAMADPVTQVMFEPDEKERFLALAVETQEGGRVRWQPDDDRGKMSPREPATPDNDARKPATPVRAAASTLKND